MFDHLKREIFEYMFSVLPNEGVGYILNDAWFPVQNTSNEPESKFSIEPGAIPANVQAVIHSHPNNQAFPSYVDMRSQIAHETTWGIVHFEPDNLASADWFFWGDDVPKQRLIGRGFRHGVTDCYEVIRDAYKLVCGLDLAPYARAWYWWRQEDGTAGTAMYEDSFAAEGFKEIPLRDLLPGDAILFNIRSDVANHAAIFLPGEKILHHLATSKKGFDPSRLSTIENLSVFHEIPKKALRYENDNIERAFRSDFWRNN